jgi:hypothetical protein
LRVSRLASLPYLLYKHTASKIKKEKDFSQNSSKTSSTHTANNNQNHNDFIIKKKDYKEPGDLDLATFCQNLEFK